MHCMIFCKHISFPIIVQVSEYDFGGGGGAIVDLLEDGLEVVGDEALCPHGSNVAWDELIIPVYATPLQDAMKRVVGVSVSEVADLHPLGFNILHWVS